MSRKCPSCGSDRCGNHAACARRHEAYFKWREEYAVGWGAVGAVACVVKHVCDAIGPRIYEAQAVDASEACCELRRKCAVEILREAQKQERAAFVRGLWRR